MRRLARLTGTAAVLAALVAALPTLLAASDPLPPRADAIFVFPGEVPERARCAAELYRRGLAPLVVFSGASVRPELASLGSSLPDAAVGALVAREAGVPTHAEVVLPEGTSTWEDAKALGRWAADHGARIVIAVTSPLHVRRARRSLRLALEPSGTEVRVLGCGSRYPLGTTWFVEERPLIAVTNEALKLLLYAVRYFGPAALGISSRPPGETP